ncbi:MAG TPA: GNAT family N-acetyltransferase [Capsulimonadaceae bacterium]|nr:GNAT family N-acetyltransferase [Capsulimonadaceae bacterium]
MKIEVEKVLYADVESLRDLYRQEANCQIVKDSALRRVLADPYLAKVDGAVAGYAAVWNKIDPDRLTEFYTIPRFRAQALPIFREILAASGAKTIGAQTNMPLELLMLLDCATNITTESILFHDAFTTNLTCSDGALRRITKSDDTLVFADGLENGDDWGVEADGVIAAGGGALYHYNPPYGDIYMKVSESYRRRGYGSFLVQEIKRICYENGKKPAARCNPGNIASRLTLQKAGFLPCARLLVGEVPQ